MTLNVPTLLQLRMEVRMMTGVIKIAMLIMYVVGGFCIMGTTVTTMVTVSGLVQPQVNVVPSSNTFNNKNVVVRTRAVLLPNARSFHIHSTGPSGRSSSAKYISQTHLRTVVDIKLTTSRIGTTTLHGSMKSFSNNKDDDGSSSSTASTPLTNNQLDGTTGSKNVVYGLLWIIIVSLAFVQNSIVPSGTTVELYDAQLLQSIIDNPTSPANLNVLYFFCFNLFAIIPILLSCLLLPIEEINAYYSANNNVSNNSNKANGESSRDQNKSLIGLSPQPFVIASAAAGYFAMGIYLTLRRNPILPSSLSSVLSNDTTSVTKNPKQQQRQLQERMWVTKKTNKNKIKFSSVPVFEFSWYTKNIWENSLLQWSIVAFIIYLPFVCNTISTINDLGWDVVLADFRTLLSCSKFASVSCIDLFLLHITCISLIPSDYVIRRRTSAGSSIQSNNEFITNELYADDEQRGNQIAACAALVPYLGTALYIALRPSFAVVTKK